MRNGLKFIVFLLAVLMVAPLAACNMAPADLNRDLYYRETPMGVDRVYDYSNNPARNTTRVANDDYVDGMPMPGNLYGQTIDEQAQTNSASILAERVRAANVMGTTGMMALDDNEIKTRLGLDATMFEDYYFLDSKNNVGEMIYIVKVKDEGDLDAVRNAFKQRLFNHSDAALATMPDKLGVSREGRIVENGRYIMLIVSDKQDVFIDSFYEFSQA